MSIHGKPLRVLLSLTGTCSCCGLCCQVKYQGELLSCENLVETADGIGNPEGSYCAVWHSRTPDMPIRMLDSQGSPKLKTICCKDSEQETQTILEKGIGRGCSLEILIRTLNS